MTMFADGSAAYFVAALRRYGERLPSVIAAFAVLAGNGNVIAVVEMAAKSDLPLTALRELTAVVTGVTGPTRIDGVLFFYPNHRMGLRMVFLDRDGTWEPMCGNGLRCVTRYAADQGLIVGTGIVVTDDGPKDVSIVGGEVTVAIGPPRDVRRLDDARWFAFTGVAQLVVFAASEEELDCIDVPMAGALLRYDDELCRVLRHPEGVHVTFAAVANPGLVIRTYEVGVEDETRCCGTGAAAAAYLAERKGLCTLPCHLGTRGGAVRVGLAGESLTLSGDIEYLLARQPLARAQLLTVDGSAGK